MSLRRRTRRLGVVWLLASLAGGSDGASAGESARGRLLPDTVLATLGERRTVDVAAFRLGWARVAPPARPDSLTPESARRFLDLLIDREALAERALAERWSWTRDESTQIANLRDRMMMRVALDSALAAVARDHAARGEPAPAPEALGIALREATVDGLGTTFDEPLLARLAQAFAALPRPSADSSIAAQLRAAAAVPAITSSDSARALASSAVGPYGVVELLDAWRRLDPLYRPRVATVEQVRDLARNGLFERALRRGAERQRLERHPRVREAIERQWEYLAVERLVARDVYERIRLDSLTLLRHYRGDPDAWHVPARFSVVTLLLPTRGEAVRMVLRLGEPAAAESLVALGRRQGIDYRAELTARVDSARFAAARRAGTGAVLGPDSVSGGWQVTQVSAWMPARQRSFAEAREQVARAWSDQEAARRLAVLLATLRRRARVVVNEAALGRLVREGLRPAVSDRGS